ncbi:Crp/Fnr family transcriptional regulator [Mesosutterella porci]|uniref:Crp/Fnr family transcriptional regulator n=1 Tax=Mesosutterella porci TaxID=2915351 RepID=UPI001EDE18B2|nr:hypothetical protein [Mesosutterella sp. oilRF-744-WT-GAM-9]MCI6531215.1 hypothetical protein [Mesosutterella sp.]
MLEQTIFQTAPWVMPEEPREIQDIFRSKGKPVRFSLGEMIPHGIEKAAVHLLTKGVVLFGYYDAGDRLQVFNILLPGRCVGEFDAAACPDRPVAFPINAACVRPVEALSLDHCEYVSALRSSTSLMETAMRSCIWKHHCTMEGMICNYTLPVEMRLRVLLYSLIEAYYRLSEGGWNPIPVPLSVTAFATVVSSNRSWVSRLFSQWSSEGLLKKDGRMLLVHSSLFDPIRGNKNLREIARTRAA